MKTRFTLVAGLLALLTASLHARLQVVATLPELAAIAQAVGGDEATVVSLAQGTEDPHYIDPRPSFNRVLNKADVLIEGGAELESGWLPPLVQNARNPKIIGDSPGHIIASRGISLLEKATGPVDRSQGDVHPGGNPHYLMDSRNASIVAGTIADAFTSIDPGHAPAYQKNLLAFRGQLNEKQRAWEQALLKARGTKVITYHKSYDYFLSQYGMQLVGTIEPKPGIEPSPRHITDLITGQKNGDVKLILIEPNRSTRTPSRIAESIGASVLVVPVMPLKIGSSSAYFDWIDGVVSQIAKALN
ncbi:MAG: metal ABC transporter substrate-binding protein [Verrucomicrobiota bacterium]|nr:metal ABC transporter substrate-binding protein [Verrucomicrobiota bacterium]